MTEAENPASERAPRGSTAAELPCAVVARSVNESLHATASIVRSWLLLEQPGAWGRDALGQSRLAPSVAAGLKARAARFGFRPLVVRRTPEPAGAGRRCFLVYSGRRGRGPWMEEMVLDDPAQLLGMDLAPLGEGHPVGAGTLRTAPLHLVCTNGRHDPCCAELGRPVYRSLIAHRPGSVWECSHIGGDRFAGNVVCFPHGLYFGMLGPDEALEVVQRYEQGRIHLDYYRGRAGDPFPVQAAEFFLRQHEGLDGVDDVVPLRRQGRGDGVVEVALSAAGRRYRVAVRVARADEPRALTCTAPGADRPPIYSLLSVSPG